MIKYIFLDVDGVLCLPENWGAEDLPDQAHSFNKECVSELERIIEQTHAKIVISSSWRKRNLKYIQDIFKARGFKYADRIVGETIRAYHYIDRKEKIHLSIPRGVEIKQWIDTHVHSDNGHNFDRKIIGTDYTFTIIDDDKDMLLEHAKHFVQTSSELGLTKEAADRAIAILNFL